ncbi:MAG: murein L,D-transpeptidase [Anaerolineales bacterium]|nr:MAG: murein L,D-transpeptidase [Anaerolineales bacterium]
MTQRNPGKCSIFSPSAREIRFAYLRQRLPNPLTELAIVEAEAPENAVTKYTFAYIRPLPASTYHHPEEAAVGLPPVRQFLAGDNWVSVMGSVEYNGERWYEINTDEYILADHVVFTNPSRFQGVILQTQPAYPFAWINRSVYASNAPGGAEQSDALYQRYKLVNIFAQEMRGSNLWYMVGPDVWIEQSYVSRVDVDPRPADVGPGEKWISINTYEQTLAGYEGDRMVYATLVSSGTGNNWTPDGLTRIWGKLPTTPMINRDVSNDNPAWYYLEDVEYTQYFNEAIALHAAYWHDSFSFTRSHGCINLATLDAKWLFEWTTPYTPPDAKIVYSGGAGADFGTWVWVHKTPPVAGILAVQ